MRRHLATLSALALSLILTLVPTGATAGTGSAAVPARATLSSTYQLLSAPVPSVCGHPAGTLVNGRLPGIASNQGSVTLRYGTARLVPVASGGTGAVAAIQCNRGGVAWPNHIVVWDRNKRVIGHFDLAKMSAYSRASIVRLSMSKGVIYGYMAGIGAKDEAACCYTRTARVALGWSSASRRYIVKSRYTYYETTYARHTIRAVNKGSRSQALRYASPGTVDALFKLRKQVSTMSLGSCFSAGASGSEFWDAAPGERGCRVEVEYPYNGTTIGGTEALRMRHPNSKAMGWESAGLYFLFGS